MDQINLLNQLVQIAMIQDLQNDQNLEVANRLLMAEQTLANVRIRLALDEETLAQSLVTMSETIEAHQMTLFFGIIIFSWWMLVAELLCQ